MSTGHPPGPVQQNGVEVTVVIPTRDRWGLLSAHALPSALMQEAVDHEVVVVDDGSTDETATRLPRLARLPVRTIRHETPLGVAAARNAGIAAARGRWIAFLDDDDLWAPRKLRLQLDAAETADWAYAAVVVVDEDGRVRYALRTPPAETVAEELLHGNVVPGGSSNVLARTALVRSLGGFDETLAHSADWDMWIRLAQAGRAAACDDVLVATLEHPDRMLFRDRPDVIDDIERLLAKYRPVTRVDRLRLTEWLADEHRRTGRRVRASALYLRAATAHGAPGNLPLAVGALFGDRGVEVASRLLVALRGRSHVVVRPPVPDEPAWLRARREGQADP